MEADVNTMPQDDAPLLYEGILQFTDVADYGVGFRDLLTGKVSVPPAGARFDVAFAGSLSGPRLRGTISGVDYVYVGPDGRAELHVHGRVTTPDGAHISFLAEAQGTVATASEWMQVYETVTLHSASADYTWVNGLAVHATAMINPMSGAIQVKGYSSMR